MGREETMESTGFVPNYTCWCAYISAATSVAVCFWKPVFVDPWYTGLLAICVATVVIFVHSFLYSNTSIYDPAWCLLPIFVACGWIAQATTLPSARGVFSFLLLLMWFLRYSVWWPWEGWAVGLESEDWRYKDIAQKIGSSTNALYWSASFFGCHLVPSLLVFFALGPLQAVWVVGSHEVPPFGLQDVIGMFVMFGAMAANGLADTQLRTFREVATSQQGQHLERVHCSKICRSGLWAYSRHPNYCAEATFWFGVAIVANAADANSLVAWWCTWGGSITMFCFFRVSGSLMDTRSLKHRKGFEMLMREVPALLPIPILLDRLVDRLLIPSTAFKQMQTH